MADGGQAVSVCANRETAPDFLSVRSSEVARHGADSRVRMQLKPARKTDANIVAQQHLDTDASDTNPHIVLEEHSTPQKKRTSIELWMSNTICIKYIIKLRVVDVVVVADDVDDGDDENDNAWCESEHELEKILNSHFVTISVAESITRRTRRRADSEWTDTNDRYNFQWKNAYGIWLHSER